MSGNGDQSANYPLRQWFDTIDSNNDGQLSVHELQKALELGNLTFPLQTIAHLIRVFDRSKDGYIVFDEFVPLHQFLINMQQSFRFFDSNSDGILDYKEIYQAVQYAGFRLDQQAFDRVVLSFDPERKGHLQLAGYISLTLFMKSSQRVFEAYDPHKSGTIHLSIDQFIYAAANTL